MRNLLRASKTPRQPPPKRPAHPTHHWPRLLIAVTGFIEAPTFVAANRTVVTESPWWGKPEVAQVSAGTGRGWCACARLNVFARMLEHVRTRRHSCLSGPGLNTPWGPMREVTCRAPMAKPRARPSVSQTGPRRGHLGQRRSIGSFGGCGRPQHHCCCAHHATTPTQAVCELVGKFFGLPNTEGAFGYWFVYSITADGILTYCERGAPRAQMRGRSGPKRARRRAGAGQHHHEAAA